jgi:MFS family permease
VSKAGAGILAGSYAAGLLLGSVVGAWVVARVGVRRTTVVGLCALAAATAGFGFASSITLLDSLRVLQGLAAGVIWCGALTWVMAIAPVQRRGEVLGSAIGAAVVGTVLGPLIGTVAVATSTEVTFAAVAVIALGLAARTARQAEPPQLAAGPRPPVRSLLGDGRLLLGFWLVLALGLTFGALSALLPLRLSRFGGSNLAIGAVFVSSAVLSALATTPIGRLVDRDGLRRVLAVGLAISALLLALLPLPQAALPLALLSVLALALPLGVCVVPATSLLTHSAERAGLAISGGTMLFIVSWALGEMLGAPLASRLSQATADAVPLSLLAGLLALSVALVGRRTVLRSRAASA